MRTGGTAPAVAERHVLDQWLVSATQQLILDTTESLEKFDTQRYGQALAGFVDAGESAEQAVHREIFEETGLYIRAPRYFSSQAWPFPHALMLGYQAEYAGGDIVCAPGEIEDARFFHVDALPPLFPIRYAMANQLLRDFCLRHGRSWPPAQAAPIAA